MGDNKVLNGTITNIQYYIGNEKAIQPVIELNVNNVVIPIYLNEQDKQGISIKTGDRQYSPLANGQEISIRTFEKDGRVVGYKSYIALGKEMPKEFGGGGGGYPKKSAGGGGGGYVKKEFDTVGAAVGGAVNAATRVFAVLVSKGEKQANDTACLRAITVDIYNMAESVKAEMKGKSEAPASSPPPQPAPQAAPSVQAAPPQPVAPGVVQPEMAALAQEVAVATDSPNGGY